jgi:hypothetical protein
MGKVHTFTHWREVPASLWRWKSFKPSEIACRGTKCGCGGSVIIDEHAMDRLQSLRHRLGKPIILNSAYRCPKHHARVSEAKNSLHLKGQAFDVSMKNHDPHVFIASARLEGFGGIGTYPGQDFCHVDTGAKRTWGKPFPQGAAEFSPEREAKPTVKSRRIQSAALSAPTGVVTAGEGLQKTIEAVNAGAPVATALADSAPMIFAGLVLLGVAGWVLWSWWDDRRAA